MNELRITLIADGSSDSTLLEIIKWLLNDKYPKLSIYSSFADFSTLPDPPKLGDVAARIRCAQKYYPFDILFYHRDAESTETTMIATRKAEILRSASDNDSIVCLVPVAMMEAWLLIDADAIKKAAGNRRYRGKVDIPSIKSIEGLSNPKAILHELLKTVSELKGRKLKNFNVHQAIHLVAHNIQDFSLLRQLIAFQEFEKDLDNAVTKNIYTQWN